MASTRSHSRNPRTVVVGAGIGGLVAALELAARGLEVTVLERAPGPGGKLRQEHVAGRAVDAGPTVLTMRWVLDELFDDLGLALDRHLALRPLAVLARHAWADGSRLDLHAAPDRTAAAIGAFAGPAEARRYLGFCRRAQAVYETLERPFIRACRPSLPALARAAGLGGLGRIAPFAGLWRTLGRQFRDARLRQLFGRYATYCGASPFAAPATLMLVAHVERQGVWTIEGGMHAIARTLAGLAMARGARFRFGAEAAVVRMAGGRPCAVVLADGEAVPAEALIVNADVAAVADGCLGEAVRPAVRPVPRSARSLSAVTWALAAPADGFPLLRHNVFFSADYRAEFEAIRRGRLPAAPTVYVCAQDRADSALPPAGAERLFLIVNAPPAGDRTPPAEEELSRCEEAAFALLARCGLGIRPQAAATVRTGPAEFARRFPGTGGALYGRASHGWQASFLRPGARSRLPGVYLAGGSVHPGPGLPMAALSGRHAAACLLEDLDSTSPSRPTATSGGTSTRSATTAATASP